MMEDIGNEKLSLTERLNLIGTAGHMEKVRIWPHDAERIVSEERCRAWLAALPPPLFGRIVRAANLAEHDAFSYFDAHDPDPSFDDMVAIGLAVKVEPLEITLPRVAR